MSMLPGMDMRWSLASSRPSSRPLAGLVVAGISVVALVAGCGSESSGASDASESRPEVTATSPPPSDPATGTPAVAPVPAGWPKCGEVWRDGRTLPVRYKGCARATEGVSAERVSCSSGQQIVLYGDHFFAVPGGTIKRTERKLQNSPEYAASIATCRG